MRFYLIPALLIGGLLLACSGGPDSYTNSYMRAAATLDRTGDLYNAERILKQAVTKGEASQKAKNYLGGISERRKKAPYCIQDVKTNMKTTRWKNRIYRYYFQLAVCYELMGETKKAMINYSLSIQKGKRTSIQFVRRGLFRERQKDMKGAERDFREALKVQDNYLPGRFQLAAFLLRQNRREEALAIAKNMENERARYTEVIRWLAKNEALLKL